MDKPDTPELDKRNQIIDSGATDVLTSFYDWLFEHGFVIAKYEQFEEYDNPQLVPLARHPEQLFADYFGVDLDLLDKERRALLEYVRSKYE